MTCGDKQEVRGDVKDPREGPEGLFVDQSPGSQPKVSEEVSTADL